MIRKLLLFLVLNIVVSSISLAQTTLPDEIRTTLIIKRKTISESIIALSNSAGINITFDPSIFPAKKRISFMAKNQMVGNILLKVLAPYDCKYKIVGNQLVISKINSKKSKKNVTLSGYLRDKSSGEPLIFANVFLQDKFIGTHSNEHGFYSFKIPSGTQRLYFSYLGYITNIQELNLTDNSSLDVSLEPEALLNEVLILDSELFAQEETLTESAILPLDKIRSIASLGGESDVIRLAQLMSGVSTGADGFGGMSVRGGAPSQNLILFDDVPVYNSGHGLGIFSVFNESTIKSAQLIKGNFPAMYGGRLSSVLDVRAKEGSTKEIQGDFTLSALTVKGTIEGPIFNEGTSFLISGRRTILDPWIKNITSFINDNNGNDGSASYYFFDLNTKLNVRLNSKNKLSLHFYKGADDFANGVIANNPNFNITENRLDQWKWGNNIYSAHWNSQLSQTLFSSLILYSSDFDFNSFDLRDQVDNNTEAKTFNTGFYQSKIKDQGIKLNVDYIPNPKHFLKIGAEYKLYRMNPGFITATHADNLIENTTGSFRDTLINLLTPAKINGSELDAYVQDNIVITKNITADVGLRYSRIVASDKVNSFIEPRISILLSNGNKFLKFGFSRMSQYLHLLSSAGIGLPTDIWIPSTEHIKPESSNSYNLSVGTNLFGNIQFSTGLYFKTFKNVISLSEGNIVPISAENDWDAPLPIGSGSSYGLEIDFTKATGTSNFLANYTLSFSERTFEEINLGRTFPFYLDRRHQFKFSYLQKINKNAEFSMIWHISSGNPISIPFDFIPIKINNEEVLVPVYSEINGSLLPIYHRMDVAFNLYNTFDWGRQKFSLGLYNAYNKQNPFSIEQRVNPNDRNDIEIFQYSILPIIPIISYSLSF